MSLAGKHCVPCRGGVPPLQGRGIGQVEGPGAWLGGGGGSSPGPLRTFPDFRTALDFVNRVGAVAEQEGHHPDLYLSWGKVDIQTWTHKIDGLTESDFILAAKIDRLHP